MLKYFLRMREVQRMQQHPPDFKSSVQQWCGKQTTNIMLGTTVMPVKDLNP